MRVTIGEGSAMAREDIFDYLVDDGGEGLVATRVGLESGLDTGNLSPFAMLMYATRRRRRTFTNK